MHFITAVYIARKTVHCKSLLPYILNTWVITRAFAVTEDFQEANETRQMKMNNTLTGHFLLRNILRAMYVLIKRNILLA